MGLTCGGMFACAGIDTFDSAPLVTLGSLSDWSAAGAVDLLAIPGWGGDTSLVAQIQNVLTLKIHAANNFHTIGLINYQINWRLINICKSKIWGFNTLHFR